MTNNDKARLRNIMRRHAEFYTDADAADECNCSVATARAYRRAIASTQSGDRT